MSSNRNDASEQSASDQPGSLSELDALLRDARYRAPAGLAARLTARALDPQAGKILFWADVERASRTLIGKVAVVAVLAASLALCVAFMTSPNASDVAVTSPTNMEPDSSLDIEAMVRMTGSPRAMDAIVMDSATSGIGSTPADPEDH